MDGMRAPSSWALLLALIACSDPATQLVVVVDTDLAIPAQARAVRAVVKNEAGEVVSQQMFGLDQARSEEVQVGLPFSFVVVPGGSAEASIRLEIEPLGPDGTGLFVWRAVTGFVANKTIRLDVFLSAACRSDTCTMGQTCAVGGCRTEIFDPTRLPEIEPGTELEGYSRPDGGTGDAGPRDAGDAGRPDTGPGDGGLDGGFPPDAGPCAPPAQEGDPCGAGALRCCGGACIDTDTTANACGPSCTDCAGNAECLGGTCECLMPFADCDSLPGCESNLDSDPEHCSACPIICMAPTPSCIGGTCAACEDAMDCVDDGLDCTAPPTCNGGICEYALLSGSCLIGGACYQGSEINPGNECLECNPMADPSDWSPRISQSCSDGLFCTTSDICGGDGVCRGAQEPPCDDGRVCTRDSCSELAGCTYAVAPGECLIGGVCRAEGATLTNNPCLACLPGQNPLDWSPNVGASCDDNLFCTATDTCNTAGQCEGGGDPCDDGLPCTFETCGEGSRSCLVAVMPGSCSIQGTCYALGDRNPFNECIICDPLISTTQWSTAPNDSYQCGTTGICCNGFCAEPDAGACGTCSMPMCGFNAYCACPDPGNPFSCLCCPNGLDCF